MKVTKKLESAYVQRMPNELKEKFLTLSTDERAAIIKALDRFHHVIENEAFELLLGILSARVNKTYYPLQK
jgi:hypothetical protein